jgi:Cu2+-exporting ATPase
LTILMSGEIQIVHQIPGRLRLRIAGMRHASGWAEAVQTHLLAHPGFRQIRVNYPACSLIIEYTPAQSTATAILAQVQQFMKQVPLEGPLPPPPDPAKPSSKPSELELLQRIALPALGLGLAVLAGAMELAIPPIVLGMVTLVAAFPVLERTRQDLAQGKVDEEILESLWTIFHGLTGDFVAPNLDLVLAETGDWLQESTYERAPAIPSTSLLPDVQRVRLIREGQPQVLPLSELGPGDQILLIAEDTCPVDGFILEGEAWLDFSILTGEPAPLPVGMGNPIPAGCTVMDGQIRVRVESLGDQTQYAQEVLLAEAAPLHQTQLSDYAKIVGETLILPTLALSGGLLLWTQNLERALAPLQLDLVTGVRLSAPTAILSMMLYAQQQNIYIRSGRVFELLTQADTVVFARTGNLTGKELSVVAIEILHSDLHSNMPISSPGSDPANWLLALAAAAGQCEAKFQHPVFQAITAYAQQRGLTIPLSQACALQTSQGLGISAQVNGYWVLVGSCSYLNQAGIAFPDAVAPPSQARDGEYQGYWYIYIAVDGQLMGQIICCASVHPDSRAVLSYLQQRGLTVYVVTGGASDVAAAIASQVGLDPSAVFAELTPEDKKAFVCRLQEQGHTVVYMGEGMDDYPALCYADIAVGRHHSCPSIQRIADIRLPYGNLLTLVTAFNIADEAMALVQQNIALITLPHLGATTLGILLILDPILVVVINNAVNLLAVLNALRPFWFAPDPHLHDSLSTLQQQ